MFKRIKIDSKGVQRVPKWVKEDGSSRLVQGGQSEIFGGSQRFKKTKRVQEGPRSDLGVQKRLRVFKGVEEGCNCFKRCQKGSDPGGTIGLKRV